MDFVFYLDESSLVSINKNQILALVIERNTYGETISTNKVNATILTQIFTTFSNLQYLNICPSSFWNNRLSFLYPPANINSSTLLELHVRLYQFSDCLYILDGRFNALHTLHIDIWRICSSDLRNDSQVDYFDQYSVFSNKFIA
jgi:hypothetical protein